MEGDVGSGDKSLLLSRWTVHKEPTSVFESHVTVSVMANPC